MYLRIDLHVHTIDSDGRGKVGDVLEKALDRGLDGLAITDHETLEGYFEARSFDSGLMLLPGYEVQTDAGHILVFGLERLPPRVERIGYEELIEWVKGLGGLTVLAHPAAGRFRLGKWMKCRPDAIEVFNASYPSHYFVERGMRLAERLSLPAVGGSDAHYSQTVGYGFTLVDVGNPDGDEVVDAIRAGSVSFGGKLSPLRDRLRIGAGYLIYKLVDKFTQMLARI